MFEIYRDKRNEWRWRFRDKNNRKILFVSSEGYKNKVDADHIIERIIVLRDSTLVKEL